MTIAAAPDVDTSYPGILDVLFGAAGYLAAAIACSAAGLTLANGGNLAMTTAPDTFQLLAFWGVMIGVCLNHAALYEQTKIGKELKNAYFQDWGLAIPLMCVFGAFLVFLAYCGLGRAWSLHECWHVAARLGSTVLAVYGIGAYRTIKWKSSDPKLFDFEYRSFFPAMATCLPAFLYGYLSLPWWLLALVSVGILALWLLTIWLGSKALIYAGLALTLLGALFALPWPLRSVSPLVNARVQLVFFGVLLTLAMGVSEAIRVTTRIRGNVEYRPTGGVISQERKDFYLGWTNVAAAVFLPLFFLTFFLPGTGSGYMGATVGLLSLQYALWFSGAFNRSHRFWAFGSVAIGLLLPIAVVLWTDVSNSVPAPLAIEPSTPWFLATVLGVLVGLGPRSKWFGLRAWIPTRFHAAEFLQTPQCLAITTWLAYLLFALFSVVSALQRVSRPPYSSERMTLVQWSYLLLMAPPLLWLMALAFWQTHKRGEARIVGQVTDANEGGTSDA